jgi:hypothetical protein
MAEPARRVAAKARTDETRMVVVFDYGDRFERFVGGLDGLERNNLLCLKQQLDKARKRVTEKVKIYAGLDKIEQVG